MFKRMILTCLLIMITMPAFAETQNQDKPDAVQITPLMKFETLSLSSQHIQSTSAGVLINSEDAKFTGIYTHHVFEKPLKYDFPSRYHSIDMLLDVKRGRHQYLGIINSESDQPVSGGINTYEASGVYGYEMIAKSNLSLVLGGGIAVGNFGVETSDGKNWPLILVPLMRINYQTDWLDTKFEFITSPNLSFTLAPQNSMRLTGDLRADQARDARDLIYQVALEYRPHSVGEDLFDFAGVSVGIKNDNYGAFNLGDKGEKESLEVHYNSLFTEVDLSVLKFTAGYAFNGRSLYREKEKEDLGEGYYLACQVTFRF